MSNEYFSPLPDIEAAGETRRLGTLVPEAFPTRAPLLAAAPGFQVWTKAQIEEAIRNKPIKRRVQFAGSHWIIDQRARGSCNAAAGTGAARRSMVLGGRNDVPILNWEFLYAQVNGGRDQGSTLDDGMLAMTELGAPPLDMQKHPINMHIFKKHYDAADYAAALNYRNAVCYQLSRDDNVAPLELATALLSGTGAGVVAVHVGRNFNNLDRNGMPPDGGGPGNHAVAVDDVEISNGELAFDSPGSWGLNWGQDGRCYLGWRNNLRRTRKYHPFFVVLAGTNPGGPEATE